MMHNKTKEGLLQIKDMYPEPEVREYTSGKEIVEKYKDAKLIEVLSHWRIPDLQGNHGSIQGWTRLKRNVLILGTKKSLVATTIDFKSICRGILSDTKNIKQFENKNFRVYNCCLLAFSCYCPM
jgi:hypothetical protein